MMGWLEALWDLLLPCRHVDPASRMRESIRADNEWSFSLRHNPKLYFRQPERVWSREQQYGRKPQEWSW